MAQNYRGFGGEAFRAAGEAWLGMAALSLPQQFCHCPGAAADLHPEQHMCQRHQTGPPARINQFQLHIWNKAQELSWRGLASACSACPDLNADLRASLASQLQ